MQVDVPFRGKGQGIRPQRTRQPQVFVAAWRAYLSFLEHHPMLAKSVTAGTTNLLGAGSRSSLSRGSTRPVGRLWDTLLHRPPQEMWWHRR